MIINQKFETLLDVISSYKSADNAHDQGFIYLSPTLDVTHTCTYQELITRAKAIAYKLQLKKIQKGDRVLLVYEPGIEFLYSFIACQLAGIIAVPCYPPINKKLLDKMRAIIATSEPKAILTTTLIKRKINPLIFIRKFIRTVAAWDIYKYQWIVSDDVETEAHANFHPVPISSDDVSFLQFTSGSTSTPKGVIVRHGNIIHNILTISKAVNITQKDKVITWLPPYHDMGLIGGLLTPLCNQIPSYVISPIDFIKHVPLWMKAITKFNGTISAAPNFAYALCAKKISEDEIREFDLSTWRAALNGAEPIRHNTLEIFKNKFSSCGFNENAFYPCYGLAESTLFVSGRFGIETTKKTNNRLVSCGSPSKECDIIIINPDTERRLEDGLIGEVCVSGPSVTTGYWNNPGTQHYFAHNHYLKTGDLGFISDNQLFITGRIKDLIIINGVNHYPHDIEETVHQYSQTDIIGDCVAFSALDNGDEKLQLIIEVLPASSVQYEALVNHIKENIMKEHLLQASHIYLTPKKTILKTTSGKLQRHANREALLRGDFTILYKV